MEVSIRTTNGKKFAIPVESETTIQQLKGLLSKETIFPDDIPINLIHKGKILEDEIKIATLNLRPNDFFVAIPINPKSKSISGPPPAPPTPTKPNEATHAAPPPDPKPAPKPAPKEPSSDPLPDLTPDTITRSRVSIEEIASTPAFSEALDQMTQSLGFPRNECEAALRAARGDANTAAEFLLSGHIPSTEELNNYGSLDNSTEFQAVREAIRAHPEALPSLLSSMIAVQPMIGEDIKTHLDDFIQSLGINTETLDMDSLRAALDAETGGDSGSENSNSGSDSVQAPQPAEGNRPMSTLLNQFTPAERESIKRLQELGFDLPTVIQSYVACDKNENLAANLLFQMGD